MKILFKLAITRRAVFSSKCTQNRLSLCPDPMGELRAGFKGPTSKEREGWGGARVCPLHIISGYATASIPNDIKVCTPQASQPSCSESLLFPANILVPILSPQKLIFLKLP